MNRIVNFRIVFNLVSRNLYILGLSLISCAILAVVFSESVYPFIIPAIIVFMAGLLFQYILGSNNKELAIKKREAYLTVSLSWILISVLGCLPYLFSGAIPSPVDAIFESVSGFTTTGSSILSDIESLPKSILFWRSMTHWIGGIGIIVLVIIIMPTLHISGYHLFSLESSLQEKIRPRIKSVGKRLLLIYIILTLAEVLFLLIGGMSLFDSFCHAFGTIATGGFSTKNNSLVDYSPYIQYVVMFFMLLAGANFVTYYYLFTRGLKKLKQNEEVRFYLKVIITLGSIISISLFLNTDKNLETSFREGFFQIISIVTTTGFATSNYILWPNYIWAILFFALFLGGSTGSTAGGIKMARYLILLRNIQKMFRQFTSPNAIFPVRLNNEVISSKMNTSIINFISIYFMIFILGSLVLVILDVDVKTASSAVATCMAGIGPGIAKIGPMNNFAFFSPTIKLILSFLMLIGRLEIYTLLVLFTPTFWKH